MRSRLLAVDPGSKQMGYAVFDSKKPIVCSYGCRNISGSRGYQRIRDACNFLIKIIVTYNVDTVVIERPPNVYRNAVALALLFDDALATFRMLGLHVKIYTPGQWRKLIGITQRKSDVVKQKALEYVDEKLGIEFDDKQHDVAEALAMGHAHIMHGSRATRKKRGAK